MKKVKKKFKPTLIVTPKLLLNSRATRWREHEVRAVNICNAKLIPQLFVNFYSSSQSIDNYEITKKIWSTFFSSKHLLNFKNFCYYTGRGRGVSRELFISRHVIRKFGRFGLLPGFIKLSC